MADVTYCIRKARGGGWSYAVADGSDPGSAPTYPEARKGALARARGAGATGGLREWQDGPCIHGTVKAARPKARKASKSSAPQSLAAPEFLAKSAGIRCRCGARNRTAASFCAGCGQPLTAVKAATAKAAALARIAEDTARLYGISPSQPDAWRGEPDPAARELLWKVSHQGLLTKGTG